jgi:tetratricopeptide (TPR) repeat protein
MGKQEEALREYRIYEDSVAALVKDSPQDLPLLRELAVSHNSVGWAYRALGRHDEALAEIRKQQEIATRLSKQDPGNVAWRRDMAQAFAASGRVLKEAGRYKEALTDYRVATRELEGIARIDPTNRSSTRDAAVSSALMASVLLRTPGGTTEAKRALSAAVGSLERLVTEEPSNAGWQHGLASAEVWLGQALERSGGKSASLRYFSRAAARLAPFTREPAEADTRLASTRAIALILGGQEREARPLIEYLNSSGWRDPDFVEATNQMRR